MHLIDHLGCGGAQVVLRDIVDRSDDMQCETVICALRTSADPLRFDTEVIQLTYGRWNPTCIQAVARLCRERQIDILHCHLQKSILTGLLMRKPSGRRVVIHEHGSVFATGRGSLYRLCLRLLAAQADLVIANSLAAAAAISKTTGLRETAVAVLGNFINPARFDPACYERQRQRQRAGLPGGSIVIGFVGRLAACKGVDLLLQAMAILRIRDDRYRLVVVGDGSEREKLDRLATKLDLNGIVHFAGRQEQPAEFMSAFDLAVIPSRREAFGIVALELMSMRVPVIASAVGGLPELVRDGQTGILLPDLKPMTIARTITDLVDNHALIHTLTINAAALCRHYDGRAQLSELRTWYEKLMQCG